MEISRRRVLTGLGAGVVGVAIAPLGATEAQAVGLGTVRIPRIALNKKVYSGTSNAVLNKGGFGHWKSSAKPGATGHSILFAHRTTAGGPMRKAHLIRIGDKILVNGVTYTVRAKEIIRKSEARRALTYGSSGRRLSLITCTKANGLPTSTAYRLIIRATA